MKTTDKVGRTIPNHLLPRWERKREFSAAIDIVDAIRARLVQLYQSNDEIWRKVGRAAIERADQLRSVIYENRPYAVCTQCNGWFEQLQGGVCPCCNSTGFMSKKQFELSDDETKRIILHDNLPRLSASMSRQHS